MNLYIVGQQVELRVLWCVTPRELVAAAASGATTIKINSITDYSASDAIVIAPGTVNEHVTTISGSPSGKTVTLTAAVPAEWRYAIGEKVARLIDPTTVTLTITDPTGMRDTYTYAAVEITKESTGIFFKRVQVTVEGVYHWKMEATGSVVGTVESKFEVTSAFIP